MQPVRTEHEQQRWQALRTGKRRALGLLVFMGALWVVAKLAPSSFWTSLLAATAEAAMVGGLADWFAVTALFRHPLGLPIPHTAVIPRNQERIGDALGRFLKSHFLAPGPVGEKLDQIDVASRLGDWLSRPQNAAAVARHIDRIIVFSVRSLGDEDVRDLLRRILIEPGRSLNVAPALGRFLEILTEARHHQLLFDRALQVARQELESHKDYIYTKVSEKSWRFMPKVIDRKIAQALIEGVLELLEELGQHDHEARRRFDEIVSDIIEGLKNSPEYAEQLHKLLDRALSDDKVQEYLLSVWEELRGLLMPAGQPQRQSRLYPSVLRSVERFGVLLREDGDLRRRINRSTKAVVLNAIANWGDEIAAFVTDQVRRWDTATLTERLELQLGPDLQFVRINGTVIGGLIGSLIFLAAQAMTLFGSG